MLQTCFVGVQIFILTCTLSLAHTCAIAQSLTDVAPNDGGVFATYRWHLGVLGSGGFAPSYQIHSLLVYEEEFHTFSAGFQAGRFVTSSHGPGVLRGRGEVFIEVNPLWLNVEPLQVDVVQNLHPNAQAEFAGYKGYGASVTPLEFRWDLARSKERYAAPWIDAGVGLLWTAHRFPQGFTYKAGGNTSRINFLPEIGIGEHIFVPSRQSIEVGARFTHVSSAGLGEYNPGVSVLQFTIGYAWWKQ